MTYQRLTKQENILIDAAVLSAVEAQGAWGGSVGLIDAQIDIWSLWTDKASEKLKRAVALYQVDRRPMASIVQTSLNRLLRNQKIIEFHGVMNGRWCRYYSLPQ